MSDLETVIDKLAITDLCYRYAMALDNSDWSALRACFTPDVRAQWPTMPVFANYDEMERTCRDIMARLSGAQHLISNVIVEVDGDRADCWSYFQTQVVRTGTPGGDTFTVGCKCQDQLVRTSQGWRICGRHVDLMWTDGNPAVAQG
jgi:3-phenylpropionate/cinnamic acid dioxygenase small subunit